MMVGEEYSGSAATEDSYMDPVLGKQSSQDRKRRFNDEQIKSLESMFENQTKLEPRKKLQLAGELGLHPRQVAIWFQNKRARWKSKQLEREYGTLRAEYDALLSSFELLKKEKQVLAKQLQNLAELLEKRPEESSNDGDSDNGDAKVKEEKKSSLSTKEESDLRFVVYSDDGEEKKFSYFSKEETDLLHTEELMGGSFTSVEQQSGFDPGCFSDQSCSSSQWWDFWPLTE